MIPFLLLSRLQCEPSGNKPSNWSTCPAMQCEDGFSTIGNTTTSGCNTTTCAYAGFSRDQKIFTTLATQSTVQVIAHNNTLNFSNKQLDIVYFEGWINVMIGNLLRCLLMVDKTAPGGSPGSFASRIGLSRNYLFICIHMILLLVNLL